MSVVCIFGTSGCKPGSFEYDSAVLLGKLLAKEGYDIATGGYGGVMEAALKGASESNTNRIGVLTNFYSDKTPNEYVQESIYTITYLERLQKLIEIGDAYVILPGGTGTLLELSAIWSLKNRKILKSQPFITFGEQWHELVQTMSFFSEEIIDNISLIESGDSIEDIVTKINIKLK